MSIVIIGSGNLATQLSLALRDAGKDIVQVYSRTEAHAQELADKIGCDFAVRLEDVRRDADVYILSIKDDAISEVAATLCSSRRDALFVHTAGSVPMSVFSPFASHYGVLYPMQTFSKNRHVDFRPIPCFIEATDAQSLDIIRSLAESVSENVVEAGRVLEEEAVDFRLFLPLIEETARKVSFLSPREAQTGPMVRYDTGIMEMQLRMLPDERTRQIYRLMADSIHEDYQPIK